MMDQISAAVTWPVRMHAGAWDDCYDEPCKHKNVTGTYGPAYCLHIVSVM